MSLTSIEIGIIINLFIFILSIICLFFVFGIVKRTKDTIKFGFNLLILGFVFFVLFEILKIFEYVQGQTYYSEVLLIAFISLIVYGFYQLNGYFLFWPGFFDYFWG